MGRDGGVGRRTYNVEQLSTPSDTMEKEQVTDDGLMEEDSKPPSHFMTVANRSYIFAVSSKY